MISIIFLVSLTLPIVLVWLINSHRTLFLPLKRISEMRHTKLSKSKWESHITFSYIFGLFKVTKRVFYSHTYNLSAGCSIYTYSSITGKEVNYGPYIQWFNIENTFKERIKEVEELRIKLILGDTDIK